jgi:hypothetical protein
MFESAELGHAITKQTYARQVPKLRESLLDAQYDLFQNGRFPVMILIGSVDGAGIRLGTRVFRDQRFRAAACREWGNRYQVLAGDQQGRTIPALQGARESRVQALQDHARGLAQPQEVGRL